MSGPLFKSANNTSVTVGNTTTVVLAANSARLGVILTNDSDEVIYLAFGASAVANKGVRLNASGGSLLLDAELIGPGAINAICASGGKNLCVVELT